MQYTQNITKGRINLIAMRKAFRKFPRLRAIMVDREAYKHVDILAIYAEVTNTIPEEVATTILPLHKKPDTIFKRMEGYGFMQEELNSKDVIDKTTHGFVVPHNGSAPFFHLGNVVVHKWCQNIPIVSALNEVIQNEPALHIYKEYV